MSKSSKSTFAILLAVLVVGGGVYFATRAAGAGSTTNLKIPGLKEAVEVYRDAKGTPHVFAKNENDLFIAYGYVSAEDRLFQMDYLRRVSGGRVAEIRGSEFAAGDKYFRTMGFKKLADDVIAKSDPETLRILQQFSKGINAYIDSHKTSLPVEFTQLGYSPEPWTPADSMLAWYDLAHALDSRRWENEIGAGLMLAKLGKDAEELLPTNDTSATIVQQGEMPNLQTKPKQTAAFNPNRGLIVDDALFGSNNWVVAGKKSVTGKVLLASDPHLRITAPSVWYEAHLQGGKYDMAGIGIPGVPFLLIGHNAKIAWAVTYSTVDVLDVYQEHVNASNQYEYMGKWLPMEVRRETVNVKGGAPIVFDVKSTRHGPLVTEIMAEPNGNQYAIRWSDYELKANEIHAYRLMNTASNWNEFTAGVKLYNTLSFNFLYGDAAGNIGYYLGTQIPIRKKGIGNVPVPGWTDEYEWTGYVPFEENPHVYNPERGWIATANNRIVGDWYPYYTSYPGNTRSERIHEILQSKEKFSMDDFKKMHSDTHSTQPRPVVPAILKAFEGRKPSPDVQGALDRLRAWKDFDFERGSTAATIYDAVYRRLTENTFADEVKGESRMLGRVSGNIAKLVAKKPNAKWWDDITTPKHETLNDMIVLSVEEAVLALTQEFGPNQDAWRWEEKNQFDIPYQVPIGSGLQALNSTHRLGPFKKEGRGGWTVDPVSSNSYRMLVDFSDIDKTLTQLSPGDSGDPASPHFSDQAQMWVNGEYKPKPHSRDKVVAIAASHVTLEP